MYSECEKVSKRNKELKNRNQFLLDENSKLICENKSLIESLEILKNEKECSNNDFQKLVLENKKLCEKVHSLEKCMVDYDVLKKKITLQVTNHYTLKQWKNMEEIEEKQGNDQEAQNLPQDVIYPKGHSKDEIIGDVSQGVRTRRNLAEETKIRSSSFRTDRPIFPKSKIRQSIFQMNKSKSFCPKIRSSGFRTGHPIFL
ncbi:hypothetical protein M9H77_26277 [Catharanthus roseus]|uniref:Uncharacterized protein n=1 Tax=Catharanthus roseus TaxID=4058 RepID=A0ACC0AA34_CATRO|nr:hypothetical protein M9H77_26277 [Catharanthus roseus]